MDIQKNPDGSLTVKLPGPLDPSTGDPDTRRVWIPLNDKGSGLYADVPSSWQSFNVNVEEAGVRLTRA